MSRNNILESLPLFATRQTVETVDYVVNGVMIGGFALIATPSQYRVTGVKTFMVSQDGVVYEKDLGPNTLEIARRIDRFNPDSSWSPVLEK